MAVIQSPEGGAPTRGRILQAALSAFGHNDYDSVSIRQIVEAAGANVAAISYHFGGKKGLYLATAVYLADELYADMQPHLKRVAAASPGADPLRCRRMLSELISCFAENLLTGALSDDAPGFIFREQNHPTEAFEALYQKLFRPMHETMVGLVACARGLPREAEEAVMVSHALLGPAFAFRAARTTILRHLSRPAYTVGDLARIKALLAALTVAALDYELHHEPGGG
jgi:AcrR family transcriptional regulator